MIQICLSQQNQRLKKGTLKQNLLRKFVTNLDKKEACLN